MIVSIDPGDKKIGTASWTKSGVLRENLTLNKMDFFEFLWRVPATLYVVEDYRLWKGRNKQGSGLETARIIGAVEFKAFSIGAEIVYQSPQILIPTAMHMEVDLPKGHVPDDVSAKLHGYRYFIDRGILLPIAQR